MKIRSVEAQLFHAEDRQTYMTKPTVAFRTATQAEAHEVRSLAFNSLCQ